MRAFIIALLLFAALVAAVLIGSRPAMGQAQEAVQHVQNSVSHYVREAEVARAQACLKDFACVMEEGRKAKARDAAFAARFRAAKASPPISRERQERMLKRISELSFAEISAIGAASRMGAEGNFVAQAWVDVQLDRLSQ